jgi:hypothetical protein
MRVDPERGGTQPRPGPRRGSLPTPLIALLTAVALALLLPAPASAAKKSAPPPEPTDGALLVHGPADLDPDKLLKRGATTLFVAGAGQFTADQLRVGRTVADDGPWLGPAPATACAPDATPLPAAELGSRLTQVASDLQFGRLERARTTVGELVAGLPCLDAFVAQEDLYRLWFLAGALEYLEGRTAEARLALSRAALVDRDAAFDEAFPPALHDLLVRAKDEVLRRPEVRIVALLDGGELRLDGRAAHLQSGRGFVELRPGTHVVQVGDGETVRTRLLALEGVPLREGTTVLAAVEAAALDIALTALLGPHGFAKVDGTLAVWALHAWLADKGLPWALVADAGPGGIPSEMQVVHVDAVTGGASPYLGRPSRGDRFTRRARIAAYVGWRGQQAAAGLQDEGRSYLEWSVGLWLPVSWVVRTGVSFDFSHTAVADEDGEVRCCTLPELGFRLRAEWPTGWGRPYLEGAFLVLWPYLQLGEQPVDPGRNHAVWGTEAWVGAIFTPGRVRRVGINVGVGAGAATEIRGWLKLRVGAELRF